MLASPGIIYVTLSVYDHEGPWTGRRGYDSLVQTASGLNHTEAAAAGLSTPCPLQALALDRATGYLMASAVMAALMRRAAKGGSWHIRAPLAQTGVWLRGFGRVENWGAALLPTFEDIADLTETHSSGFGSLTTMCDAARLSQTRVRWEQPAMPLGPHPPAWV